MCNALDQQFRDVAETTFESLAFMLPMPDDPSAGGSDAARQAVSVGFDGPFVGAIFLIVADTLCRTLGPWLGTGEVPVGVVTALCGGPFFIYLLRSRMREAPA